jgi:hypothetical protein
MFTSNLHACRYLAVLCAHALGAVSYTALVWNYAASIRVPDTSPFSLVYIGIYMIAFVASVYVAIALSIVIQSRKEGGSDE